MLFLFLFCFSGSSVQFLYNNFWYTTLSDSTVRTGKENTDSNHNAVEGITDFSNLKINIPSFVYDEKQSKYEVVEIGIRSFRGANGATIVSLPETLVIINNYAFDIIGDT